MFIDVPVVSDTLRIGWEKLLVLGRLGEIGRQTAMDRGARGPLLAGLEQ